MANIYAFCIIKGMKVLLYFEGEKIVQISGIGRAKKHQMMALTSAGVDFTTNPFDDYDILHINTCYLNSDAIIHKARSEGKAVIYHAHSTEEDFRNSFLFSNQLSPFVKKYLVSLYSKADEIITPTPYAKKLLESYGIKLPINAISNGIDLKRFAYDTEKVKAFRRYFGLDEKDKVVMSVGLFFERKGILDFFEVAEKLPEYTFIWFGTTPEISIPKSITEAIRQRPFNVIMPGYVKGGIIEGAYMACDCFFFPSYEETEGIVVLEAMAAKSPIVVRSIGAYEPWLVNGENCYMGENNSDFVKLVKDTVEKRLPTTGEKAYMTAKERSIENVGQALKKVYTRVYQKMQNEKAVQ